MNLIEFFKKLFLNPREAAKFQADPQAYLEENGVTDATYEELNEAVTIACSEPVSQGAQVATGGSAANQGSGQATATTNVASPTSPATSGPATSSAAPTAPAATPTAPPPPPPPPPDMPPADMVQEVVNHYVTEVYETNQYVTETVNETTVYDNDTNVDNSVTNVVDAEEGAVVQIHNDNDATTASGEGSAAFGEDSDIDGYAQGDGAVAAGDDINAPVVTGTNEGIVNDNGQVILNDSAVGDDNVIVDDGIVGDSNVQAQGDGNAAGGDVNDTDVSIGSGANVEDSNFGVGNTSASDDDVTLTINDNDTLVNDNDVIINDNDGIDIDDNDGIDVDDQDGVDVDLLSDQDIVDLDLGAGAPRALTSDSEGGDPLAAAKLVTPEPTSDPAPEVAVAEPVAAAIEEPPPVEDLSRQVTTEEPDVILEEEPELLDLD